MHNLKVNNYMRLPAALYSTPLVMPSHVNPITGEDVPEQSLFGGNTIEESAYPVNWNHDKSEFVFGLEFSAEELFYIASIGYEAGGDSRVMNHSEARELVTSEKWVGNEG